MDEERLFTLTEASQLLPQLRTLLGDASTAWRRMKELSPEIQRVREKAQSDGFAPHGVEYVGSVMQLMGALNEVKELGVEVKDIEKGLCDFPYIRNGRKVYLCWQLGEDSIAYWHEIESGFAGREPLDETDG
jgi:hypothetical protein